MLYDYGVSYMVMVYGYGVWLLYMIKVYGYGIW